MATEVVARWAGAPPVGWPAAARRLVDGLAAASAARRQLTEQASRRTEAAPSGADARGPAVRGAVASRDVMLSATSKLSALKSDTGEVGRRAVDAAVVLPLCAPA
eukprot:3369340-Pleurochrysis_carterae.AAC.1